MNIDEIDLQKFEDLYKKLLYDKINEQYSNIAQQISLFDNERLPNIGTTCNNKLVGIFQELNRSQIPITELDKNTGTINSTFIINAITEDLFSNMSIGMQDLSNYSSSLKGLTKIIFTLKPFLKKLHIKIPLSQKSTENLATYLDSYKSIDNKLFNYNLRDNLAHSIIIFVSNNKFSTDTILNLLDTDIIPAFQKLGLSDQITQLKKDLMQECKTPHSHHNKSWELTKSQKLEIQQKSKQITHENSNKEKQPTTKIKTH